MAKIVQLSEAASIALHAMILVAKTNGESINVDKISEITGNSRHHVAKVMQRLSKNGFVNSSRGPNGGFFLIEKPNKIKLIDIYEAIEGKITISQCPKDKQICPFDKCFMQNITSKMTMEFKKYMEGQTLQQYL